MLTPFCTVPRIDKPRPGPPYRIRRGPRTRCQLRSVSGAAADMVLIPQSGHRPGLVRVTVSDHRAKPQRRKTMYKTAGLAHPRMQVQRLFCQEPWPRPLSCSGTPSRGVCGGVSRRLFCRRAKPGHIAAAGEACYPFHGDDKRHGGLVNMSHRGGPIQLLAWIVCAATLMTACSKTIRERLPLVLLQTQVNSTEVQLLLLPIPQLR